MGSISSLSPLSNILANEESSLIDPSSSSNFSSVLAQAMSAATTPVQKAQVDLDEVQLSNLNVLSSMADSSSSDGSSSLDSLFSIGGSNSSFSSPPAWETDLIDLLGPNSTAAQAFNLGQQASLLSESLFNSDLDSLI